MNIKIEIKDTATLSRIESLCKALQMQMHWHEAWQVDGYADVIENIDMER